METHKIKELINLVKETPNVDAEILSELIGGDERIENIIKLVKKSPDIDADMLVNLVKNVVKTTKKDIEEKNVTKRRRYTKKEIDTLFSMRKKGFSYKEISRATGRTEKSLQFAYSKHKDEYDLKTTVRKAYSTADRFLIRKMLDSYGGVPNSVPTKELLSLAELLGRTEGALRTQLYSMREDN